MLRAMRSMRDSEGEVEDSRQGKEQRYRQVRARRV